MEGRDGIVARSCNKILLENVGEGKFDTAGTVLIKGKRSWGAMFGSWRLYSGKRYR